MKLWHLTPTRNLGRISRAGLRARSSRWGENTRRTKANRIYFTTTRGAAINHMLAVLQNEDIRLGDRGRQDDYALLSVETASIPDMKFYVDPEHPTNSVYTTRRVLAKVVRLEEAHIQLRRGRKF